MESVITFKRQREREKRDVQLHSACNKEMIKLIINIHPSIRLLQHTHIHSPPLQRTALSFPFHNRTSGTAKTRGWLRGREKKSIQITTEKVALMARIAAYVYTKSGNLSSYGLCNAGGVRVRPAHTHSPITPTSPREAAVSIGWEDRGPAGSQWGARVKGQGDLIREVMGLISWGCDRETKPSLSCPLSDGSLKCKFYGIALWNCSHGCSSSDVPASRSFSLITFFLSFLSSFLPHSFVLSSFFFFAYSFMLFVCSCLRSFIYYSFMFVHLSVHSFLLFLSFFLFCLFFLFTCSLILSCVCLLLL